MLTERQKEIAGLVARGLTDRAIARETGLSESTVGHHVTAAARRVPGQGRPRRRLTVWFLGLGHDDARGPS